LKDKYVIEMTSEFLENMGEYENLILNLMAGVEIDDLSEDEIQILKNKHGENWRIELGYE
jgi:hypothetical protein